MTDLLTAPLDELGLAPETLVALNVHAAAAGAYAGGRRGRGPLTVEGLLLVLQSPNTRRVLCRAIGRAAYADLVAEFDDHGLIPLRWGVGVEPAYEPLPRPRGRRSLVMAGGVPVLVDSGNRVVAG